MRQLFLTGYPLGHSISPLMQNAALKTCGLNEWRYEKIALPPERLSEFLTLLRSPNCAGANVTIPHKEAILSLLDGVSETAREIGAVNTIINRDGKLFGENTDVYGFIQTLTAYGFSPRGASVVILGAGGAARAVAWGLARAGVAEIALLNRTSSRALALAAQLSACWPALVLEINNNAALAHADLIVNATPVGMWPSVDASPLAFDHGGVCQCERQSLEREWKGERSLQRSNKTDSFPSQGDCPRWQSPSGMCHFAPRAMTIKKGVVVFDLIYNPRRTRLLREAEERGATVIDGLDMLVYQGARAFGLWTGCAAPVEVMQHAASAALEGLLEE